MIKIFIVIAILIVITILLAVNRREKREDEERKREESAHLKVCTGCQENWRIHFYAKVEKAKTLPELEKALEETGEMLL